MILSSCNFSKPTKQATESFPVTSVMKVDTFNFTDYVAEIHALQNVEIRARVSGYLEKIYVDEGAYVTQNQLLFSINNKEYVEELAKAKALYKSAVADMNGAELELKSVSQLADKKIVSATEVELAKNKLEARKAQMEEAKAHQSSAELRLSNTGIRAPFNGIINRIPHKIGSLIEEGTLLTSISENDEIFAYFDVSEKEYLAYARNNLHDHSGNSRVATLILADGSEHSEKGKIETVEGVIDNRTGNIAFRARFKNPGKIIKHGASGKIRLKKKFENVIVVPQKSTFEIQDKLYVYVVGKDNKLEMRQITAKTRLPHLYLVTQGLNEHERILYEGIQNVKAGAVINPEPVAMEQIIRTLASK